MSGYLNSFYEPMSPEKEAAYFYRQRQQKRKSAKPIVALDVEAIADVDNLADVFDLMRRTNGEAPGPDRVRFQHLGRRELYDVLRATSKVIVSGAYRPGATREVKIPKSGNRGYRTLNLGNLIDRIVAKAVNQALMPFWERHFLDGSHGFRPDRSNWTFLAKLEKAIVSQNRWVLVSDDIKNAFPSVNNDHVVVNHWHYLGDNPKLLALIEAILRGGDQDRRLGLDQGCPYMPTALNVLLTRAFAAQAHVLGVLSGHAPPLARYPTTSSWRARTYRKARLFFRK